MKAITIKQPWASLITHGIKDIENRTWPTKYRGRVLVHAAMKLDDRHREMSHLFTSNQWKSLDKNNQNIMVGGVFTLGAIIGSIEIVDCVINHPSIWAERTNTFSGLYMENPIYNWVLSNPILFPEPIHVKGKLSFWDYPNILAEPEEDNGELFCHCQISVKEENQVMSMGDGTYMCRYCGGKWYR